MNEVEKNNWERILAYIKTEHYINKLYDSERGFAYLTARNLVRYRIDFNDTLEQVKKIIKQIKEINN